MSRLAELSAGELRDRGTELGHDLAAALLLAARRAGGDRDLTRQMSRIVLREISAAVSRLRDAHVPEPLVETYEHACRARCRDVLLAAVERDSRRRAA